ncbi:hypothetical protein BAC1_01096 [uncultured bacterium]|nr:hypothetical protein BAC1_01096 [uncultured bacterium]
MPYSTRMFDWHDPEFRHADEVYLAIVIALTLAMIIGYFAIW